MKWVELKNYLAPTFMKEIDHVCEIFIDLIRQLQVDRYNDEIIGEYLDLKQSIEERIEEIETFYEMNFDQPYAQHFEKGRIKLKKLLMFEPFAINEIPVMNNTNKINNKNKGRKNNVYEINGTSGLYTNTIDTNFTNFKMGNDFSMGGTMTNKTKKPDKRQNISFIPVEVKKKNNNRSMEKIKNFNNSNYTINTNKSRNKKYNDVDVNNKDMYLKDQINNNNQKKYDLPNMLRKNNNVLNKFKKPKMSSSMDKQSINSGYRKNRNQNQDNYFINDEEY